MQQELAESELQNLYFRLNETFVTKHTTLNNSLIKLGVQSCAAFKTLESPRAKHSTCYLAFRGKRILKIGPQTQKLRRDRKFV